MQENSTKNVPIEERRYVLEWTYAPEHQLHAWHTGGMRTYAYEPDPKVELAGYKPGVIGSWSLKLYEVIKTEELLSSGEGITS